jgi:protein TonB
MRILWYHWMIGFSSALLMHVVVMAGLLWEPKIPRAESTESAESAGIEISLGSAVTRPGSVAGAVTEILKAESVAAAEAALQGPSEKTVATPPAPVQAEAVESVDAPEVEAVTPVVTTEVEAVGAETAATAVEVGSVAAQPVEQVSPGPTLAPGLAEKAGGPPREETTARTVAATGALDPSGAGGVPRAQGDYVGRLQAWLGKHKKYPRRARVRRQEGTVLLHLVIDRDGSLREYRIKKSSGYDLLDRAAIAMIKRAQPLPRFPDSLDRTRIELVVPVQFVLR